MAEPYGPIMTPPAPTPRRSRGSRWVWAVLCVLVVAGSLVWATEPHRRRFVVFEAPIRLEPGQAVTGRFTPNHEGYYAIEVRFQAAPSLPGGGPSSEGDAAPDPLGDLIRELWSKPDGPPGLAASYVIRRPPAPEISGATGKGFSGSYGHRGEGVLVELASFELLTSEPHEFDVRLDRADPRLARWDARLVVAASDDWANYAGLEAQARQFVVLAAFALTLLGLGVRAALRTETTVGSPKA